MGLIVPIFYYLGLGLWGVTLSGMVYRFDLEKLLHKNNFIFDVILSIEFTCGIIYKYILFWVRSW